MSSATGCLEAPRRRPAALTQAPAPAPGQDPAAPDPLTLASQRAAALGPQEAVVASSVPRSIENESNTRPNTMSQPKTAPKIAPLVSPLRS